MKYSRSELLAFIPDIYDAAGDPTKWNNVLLRLTELAGAHAGHIYFQDIKTSQVGWVAYAGLTIDDGRRYRDHYAAINPFWTNRPELYSKAGDVFTRKMISDNATCGRTEFYNDFAKPLRLFDFVGGTLFKQGTRSGRLALFRPPEAEPCGKEEMELVRLLMPHLVRSIELHTKIAHLENNSEILLNTLDRIPQAVILLDAEGKIKVLNQKSEAILSRNDGLTISGCELCARSAAENIALRKLVHDAASIASGKSMENPGGNALISRGLRLRPYCLTVTPLPPTALIGLETPAVAVFIADPSNEVTTPDAKLQFIFRFTPAETRLAQHLMLGISLPEAAEKIGVSHNTVKTQLSRILEKTETHRQSELIRVLTVAGLSAIKESRIA
jgi:DNA-binding CsgD family transcriptional regulator/PAS domain-containing protein